MRSEFSKVPAYQGPDFAGLVAEFEHGFDLGDDGRIRFEKAFRGRVNLDTATREVEEGVAARFVVDGMVPAGWDGAVEVLKVEDVWSHPVAAFCCCDDALEKEGVCDADDEGLRCAAVDAYAFEVGLHGHVRFNNSSIRDRAD